MDSFSDSDNDSDKELQAAFSKGTIRGKLVGEVSEKKPVINNKAALLAALETIKSSLPWIERMDVTANPIKPPGPLRDQLGDDPDDLTGDEVHNDFKREYRFHRQAQAAVLEGLKRLHSLNVPTRRPNDNFAEMVKSDVHMKRVREKLLTEQLRMERSEKVKKLRDLKKYGKKVQQEVKMKRQKEKKDMTDAIKRFRKGQDKSLDVLENKKPTGKKQTFEPNPKRKFKNDKYGFGGQKKRSKSNNSASVDQVSFPSRKKNFNKSGKASSNGFQGNKNKSQGNKNKGRPGKSKRQKMKSKGK